MPLRSEFFRGDARLEGAASRDSAHVIPGTSGPHVEKIQLALMLLDDARIAQAELEADAYGPTTAAAVLAYKRRRRIVNERYQTMPDSIVGRMTMAALDREMTGRQAVRKRCGCTYVPTYVSTGRLQPKPYFFAFAVPAGLGGAGGGTGTSAGGGAAKQLAGAPQSTLDMALAAVPAASAIAARGPGSARRRDRRRPHAAPDPGPRGARPALQGVGRARHRPRGARGAQQPGAGVEPPALGARLAAAGHRRRLR
ncbi:peptidoglycan-binding domain-containing protein [Reyranella massiliensis]|uniref:peptidoglycan-binding domain-containing protein n=1 Tax=Reyranella massiliensis TaxID=445220 RepID=UPI0002FF0435|nr:hypothetical protein [Reyranella massiliensis]